MMSIGHFFDAGGYLDHGDASVLLPVEELDATVHTHRDAELALGNTASGSVLVVRPTGLASSYALTQRPLTAIEVASLGEDIRAQLEASLDGSLAQFEVIQVGRATSPAKNRSLAEF